MPAPPRGVSPRGHVLHRPPTPRHPPCAHHRDVLVPARTPHVRMDPVPAVAFISSAPRSVLPGGGNLPLESKGGVRGQDRGNRSFKFFSQSLHTHHRARPARWVHRHSCTQPVFVVQDPAQPPVSQRKARRTPDDPGHGRSHQVVPAWHVVNVHSGGAGSRPVARPRPPSTGGAAGTRTPDPRRAKAVLSQLSYDPRSALPLPRPAATGLACALPNSTPAPPPAVGGRAWTRTRGLGLIRAAL
jgi:hypothetical protein